MVTVLGELSVEKQAGNDNRLVHCAGEREEDTQVVVDAQDCGS